jgi:hypothetical protein
MKPRIDNASPILLGCRELKLQLPRQPDIVGIEKGNKFPAAVSKRQIPSRSWSGVLFLMDLNEISELTGDVHSLVCRPVVDDDHLERGMRLRLN